MSVVPILAEFNSDLAHYDVLALVKTKGELGTVYDMILHMVLNVHTAEEANYSMARRAVRGLVTGKAMERLGKVKNSDIYDLHLTHSAPFAWYAWVRVLGDDADDPKRD